MSSTIDDHRCKLVTDIMFANSTEEVKRYIGTAVNQLIQHKVNGHFVARFVDRILSDLGAFDPMGYDSRQWTNIEAAVNHLAQLKRTIHTAETATGKN